MSNFAPMKLEVANIKGTSLYRWVEAQTFIPQSYMSLQNQYFTL